MQIVSPKINTVALRKFIFYFYFFKKKTILAFAINKAYWQSKLRVSGVGGRSVFTLQKRILEERYEEDLFGGVKLKSYCADSQFR